jgi:hypothetical protein
MDVERIVQQSPLLGRHKVHDPRSRDFALPTTVDRSTWRTKAIRVYDPSPNPNQPNGCCTAVAKCVQLNAAGNRKPGRVLNMDDAQRIYARETVIDPFPGTFPPDDTGSDGLSSCKVAVEEGLGGEYLWLFGGADEVVQNVMAGRVVSVGTSWYWNMFNTDADGRVSVSGDLAGGHQWSVRGYSRSRDWVLGRCWWGTFRDFWIARSDLDALLRDGGDAHWQRSA